MKLNEDLRNSEQMLMCFLQTVLHYVWIYLGTHLSTFYLINYPQNLGPLERANFIKVGTGKYKIHLPMTDWPWAPKGGYTEEG